MGVYQYNIYVYASRHLGKSASRKVWEARIYMKDRYMWDHAYNIKH